MGNTQGAASAKVDGKGDELEDLHHIPGYEPIDVRPKISLRYTLSSCIGNQSYADVLFVVGPKKAQIFGHKVIIAARSEYFHQQFENWKREELSTDASEPQQLQIIDLPDVGSTVFQTMLKCIYTDTTDITPHTVAEVLKAARRYKVEALIETCTNYMAGGLTVANCVDMLSITEKEALAFILEHGDEVVKHPSFVRIKRDHLLQLVKSEDFCVEEVALWDALYKWAGAFLYESKQGKAMEDNMKGMRQTLDDFIPYVRFPLMSFEEFARSCADSGILTDDEQLDVFEAIAATDENNQCESKFSSLPRRFRPVTFTWRADLAHGDLTVTDGGTVVTSQQYRWKSMVGDAVLVQGFMEYHVKLVKYDKSNGFNVVVGVVPENFPADLGFNNLSEVQTAVGYANVSGWSFITGTGKAFNGGNNGKPIFRACNQGDIITVRVEIKNRYKPTGTITFSVNGVPVGDGPAFSNLQGPVRAAISVCQKQETRMSAKYDSLK